MKILVRFSGGKEAAGNEVIGNIHENPEMVKEGNE